MNSRSVIASVLSLASVFLFSGCATTTSLPFATPLEPEKISSNLKWEELSVEGIADANLTINSRLKMIEELIAPNIDPYKGVDSVPEICRTENLPKNFRQSDGKQTVAYASFYSSQNKVLGLCADPNQLMKTQYLLLYCGEDKVYVIRYFYGSADSWRREPVASCAEIKPSKP